MMNKKSVKKGARSQVNPFTHFTARVLSVGSIQLDPHQWLIPKSNSLFWSVYIPDQQGLELGSGKGSIKVPSGSIALVPPGASAARDNTAKMTATFLHFDIGGYAGIELSRQLNKIVVIPAKKFSAPVAAIKAAALAENQLALQLCSHELLSGVLAECISDGNRNQLSQGDVRVIQPALCAIEERLNSMTYQPLKISEMAALCGLKPLIFSRVFFEITGKNPAWYAQARRIAVAVQQLLFSDKSIDDISDSLRFANRFYFSRVFKDEVGDTPAAYRAAFRAAK
jgi:AraC-like DNA-binding protein